MTRDVRVRSPEEPIVDCARAMANNDIGALPVAENNLLLGMVTDRDIAIRAVAAGKGPGTLSKPGAPHSQSSQPPPASGRRAGVQR